MNLVEAIRVGFEVCICYRQISTQGSKELRTNSGNTIKT